MRLERLKALLFFVFLVSVLSFTTSVQAATEWSPPENPPEHNPCIYIDDLDDDTDDYFESPGETVRIWSYSQSVPYTVYVYRSPSGQSYDTYVEPTILVKTYEVTEPGWVSTDLNDVSNPGGTWWKAEIIETETKTAKGTYFVVPETSLGIIMTITACFASLGIKRLQRK